MWSGNTFNKEHQDEKFSNNVKQQAREKEIKILNYNLNTN